MAETSKKPKISPLVIDDALRALLAAALVEDTGSGDVTTLATIPEDAQGAAVIVAKKSGVICGLTVAATIFKLANRDLKCEKMLSDGAEVYKGDVIMQVSGPLHGLLQAERVALNFLQRLSGIATLTDQYVQALDGPHTGIYDTRKTTPLWRELERYAVRCGGGRNHRFCLDDMILIKDNHVDASGGVGEAVRRAREWVNSQSDPARRKLRIMVEVRDLGETRAALAGGADLIMLDNMRQPMVEKALAIVNGKVPVEISGGLSPQRIMAMSGLRIDRISVGALTHSAPALDISLQYVK